jgi:hypothetical protein
MTEAVRHLEDLQAAAVEVLLEAKASSPQEALDALAQNISVQ